jgi:hypothetical protein
MSTYIRSRHDSHEEGSDYHQFLVRETARLGAIRDKMVADLEAKGVSGRYLSEMKNVDISKILRR